MRAHLLAPALLATTVLLGACGGTAGGSASSTSASEGANAETGTLTVFAAASLNQVFPKIATDVFAKDHPGVKVSFSYDGSSALVDQLKNGAPADVFASADTANMDKAEAAKVVTNSSVFTSNVLVLVVPPGNPAKVTGLDSSLDGKKLVVCAPQVPCGAASHKLADQLGYTLRPVSEEQKVTDVLAKVSSGEADAGLVYATDAKSAGSKVAVVDVPGSEKVVNNYKIAVVAGAKNEGFAKQFITAVESPEGQKILADYGFRAAS